MVDFNWLIYFNVEVQHQFILEDHKCNDPIFTL